MLINSDDEFLDQFKQGIHNNIDTDDALTRDDRSRLQERNGKYSEILDAYTKNAKRVLWIKLIFRVVFLIVSIGALVGTFGLFCTVLWWIAYEKIDIGYMQTMVSIISSMVSMITVFIVLPKIMTKYLFDIEEEKNIYNIVKQIQEYDHVIRKNG